MPRMKIIKSTPVKLSGSRITPIKKNPGERIYAVGNNQLLMEARGLTQSEAVNLLKRHPQDDLGQHNYIFKRVPGIAGSEGWKKVTVRRANKKRKR